MFLFDEKRGNNIDKNGGEIGLWESLCLGEKGALDELFRLYFTLLFDYGIKITSNEDNIKDAIQELFLKLWKKHNSLDSPDSIKAYLLVSFRRILLRNIKRERNRYERNRKYIEDDVFDSAFSKEDLMIRDEIEDEKKERLVQTINHLNSRQKETLFLRYYHGLTNQEIANVMNINRQSVKNNLCRAFKNMKGIIRSVPNIV